VSRRSQLRETLRADADRLAALVERHGTPLLTLQPHLVARRYRQLADALRGFRLHYAVKALPNPLVLSTIAICGGGFDVASCAEVDLLTGLGVPMDRCIHTHPVKKPSDIDHAYAAGIRTFIVENPCEAAKFTGRPNDIELLVRLAFRNPNAKSDLSSKFGAPPADAELMVKHVLATGVCFAGFTFHVGSQTSSVEPYRAALRGTLDLVAHVEDTLGVRSRVIDIGGGFPVSYRDDAPDIDSIAEIVDDVLGGARDDFTLLAEPGRFLVADCMTLVTSVVGSAMRDGQLWHYLDDGLYGSY
jgi:ornithine decarboxylase